ncbi:hypothetical protein [Robiginitomaculum antarcticum]|uniref:hypothetical protein n=1 Tax=Robiginitomaculum antarcticum TaxID=437507 RepID=UPI00037F8FFF|nr:hypothetical protein [Robiginitomaculum antarcticum]
MTTDIERLSARRSFLLMFTASAFLIWQVPGMDFFSRIADGPMQAIDLIALSGAFLWIIALLWLLLTQRKYSKLSADENAMLEDELVKANRVKSLIFGYWAMLVVAVIMFVAGLAWKATGFDAAHMVIVAGVVVPMYSFAWLERRNA